ncbi:MAG: EF-P lysine aminoacylase EpmA [Steroidobacteraceae bacterium]
MSDSARDWRPTASRERLQARAAAFHAVRRFFRDRGLLEVDTPQRVRHAVTDVQLHSVSCEPQRSQGPATFLHTSPEYAMKRLLAAGSGDIWQLCHVFRGNERGPQHNAEFTLIEWYRLGWSMQQLMGEVAELLVALVPSITAAAQYQSYQQVMQQALGIDVLGASDAEIADCAIAQGFEADLLRRCSRDELLDLLMGARVGPTLGRTAPCFVHSYPASQAALARLDPDDARVARRFELYVDGIELCNGFEELASEGEQRARFEADNTERERRGLPPQRLDESLLGALRHGLPPCAGVAMGFDRVLMLACGARQIDEVMAFPAERA